MLHFEGAARKLATAVGADVSIARKDHCPGQRNPILAASKLPAGTVDRNDRCDFER
jgi:hypothetical protein